MEAIIEFMKEAGFEKVDIGMYVKGNMVVDTNCEAVVCYDKREVREIGRDNWTLVTEELGEFKDWVQGMEV